MQQGMMKVKKTSSGRVSHDHIKYDTLPIPVEKLPGNANVKKMNCDTYPSRVRVSRAYKVRCAQIPIENANIEAEAKKMNSDIVPKGCRMCRV
jgi:hypothetical protein